MVRSPITVSKFRNTFFGWWAVWALLQGLLIYGYGYPFEIAAIDSIVTNILMLAACWMVTNILRFYMPEKDRKWYILFLSIILSLMVTSAAKWILGYAYTDKFSPGYSLFLSNSFCIRLCIAFLLIGCMTIICVLWYTVEEEQVNRQRKEDAERLSRDAELYKLRQQLQPHFLFNSLNSISALISSQPEQARKMIYQLSDFLRATLRKEEEQWVKMEEELQTLELYLDIEKVRFGHRLTTFIEKDNACLQMQLPPMLLQPVMENAIKFGLYDTTDVVTISMFITKENDYLKVVVKNPFDLETSTPKRGTGFGLNSVKRRLYLLFARNDLVETEAEDHIFTTSIRIPQQG
ncbi:MAG: histidine kinase [Bacteroidota bacterium]|nr:histidine kinase [Bacteroidota bacterium]MDP4211303.1 histidine kinase [Bacteroidota bacterium]MDP4250008.1 histidine kinase [Bacteroidota bacterium]